MKFYSAAEIYGNAHFLFHYVRNFSFMNKSHSNPLAMLLHIIQPPIGLFHSNYITEYGRCISNLFTVTIFGDQISSASEDQCYAWNGLLVGPYRLKLLDIFLFLFLFFCFKYTRKVREES